MAEAGQAHLVFKLAEYSFAVEIAHVTKVHDLAVKAEVLEWGDQVDLARFFGISGEKDRAPHFRVDMLVGNQPWSFNADAVENIQDFGLALTLEFPALLRHRDNLALAGFYFDGLRLILRMDAAELMVSRRFREFLGQHGVS